MEIKLIFGLLAAIIETFCLFPYLKDIWYGETEPHIYTWLIWTILQTIGVIAAFSENGGYGVLVLVADAILCGIIFIFSIKHGTKNISNFDLFCLVSALVTTIFYILTNNSLVSVVLVTVIDFIGFLPTFRKGWEEPESETVSTFYLSGFAKLISLFALENYTVVTVLYIASLFLSNTLFATELVIRRKILRK